MHGKAIMTELLITLYMHTAGMTVEIMHAGCIPYISSTVLSLSLSLSLISSFATLSFLFSFVDDPTEHVQPIMGKPALYASMPRAS